MTTPTFDQIIDAVSRQCGVHRADVLGKSRKAHIVYARHLAVYVVRELLGWPWKRIGAAFGGRDHSSMMYAHTGAAARVAAGFQDEADVRAVKAALAQEGQTA